MTATGDDSAGVVSDAVAVAAGTAATSVGPDVPALFDLNCMPAKIPTASTTTAATAPGTSHLLREGAGTLAGVAAVGVDVCSGGRGDGGDDGKGLIVGATSTGSSIALG